MAKNPIAIIGGAFLIMIIGVYGINRWLGRQIKEAGDFRSFGMEKIIQEIQGNHYREEDNVSDSMGDERVSNIFLPIEKEPKVKKIIYELPLDELSSLK